MPRSKPKHVTQASTTGGPIHENWQTEISQALIDRGFDKACAQAFAKACNRAAVFAYELDPKMSTEGESRRWFDSVHKAALARNLENLRKVLAAGDPAEVDLFILSERLFGDDRVTSEDAWDHLVRWCQSEMAHQRRPRRRRKTCRQLLAEDLVHEWRTRFGHYPVYWIEPAKGLPPFLGVLKDVLLAAEIHYLQGTPCDKDTDEWDNVLRNLAKRAVSAERRRLQVESQFSQ